MRGTRRLSCADTLKFFASIIFILLIAIGVSISQSTHNSGLFIYIFKIACIVFFLMLGGYNFYLGFKKLKGEEHHWYKDKNLSFGAAWISVCIGYFILFFTSERILNIPLELFSAIFFLLLGLVFCSYGFILRRQERAAND
jgi:hypothetical protein